MGFSLREISNFFGRPVCLYEFQWGETFYRYTSADRSLQYPYIDGDPDNGVWYKAIAISDNGFSQGTAGEFTVVAPRSIPVIELFRSTPPSTPITLTCRRFHRDDPDDEAVVYWTGTVGNVRGKDVVKAEILGLSIGQTVRRTGLRMCWEVNCPNALYDAGCKVDKDLFRTDTTITALTGITVTVADLGDFPGARYAGGFLEWEATAEGTIDRRAIETFNGGLVFGLLGTTDRLEVGMDISLFCGCDLTAETCDGFFDNLPNHAGFRFMPKKSPFDGTPVF